MNHVCPANKWKCHQTHHCITEDRVCVESNGSFPSIGECCLGIDFWSCTDNSNEDVKLCRNYTCLDGCQKMNDGKCIKESLVCNGIQDYSNGADEMDCESHSCSEGFVKCADMKTCISVSLNFTSSFEPYFIL